MESWDVGAGSRGEGVGSPIPSFCMSCRNSDILLCFSLSSCGGGLLLIDEPGWLPMGKVN